MENKLSEANILGIIVTFGIQKKILIHNKMLNRCRSIQKITQRSQIINRAWNKKNFTKEIDIADKSIKIKTPN